MDITTVIDRYYELANYGRWDEWCDLFAADAVLDEQLAGRIEGRDDLRALMAGFPTTFRRFANIPRRAVVQDGQAAVVSHISAETMSGDTVEADVCNVFDVRDGVITHFANFHDSRPFAVVTGSTA